MSLHTLANHLQSAGRGEDKVLVHMTPKEVGGLQSLAMAHGGSLTINPETGLPEAGFLSSILPMIAGFALGPAGFALMSAPMAGLTVGALTGVATGSLKQGLMAGLGAYGGAGLGQGLMAQGAQAAPSAAAGSIDDVAAAANMQRGNVIGGGINAQPQVFGQPVVGTGGGMAGFQTSVPNAVPTAIHSGGVNTLPSVMQPRVDMPGVFTPGSAGGTAIPTPTPGPITTVRAPTELYGERIGTFQTNLPQATPFKGDYITAGRVGDVVPSTYVPNTATETQQFAGKMPSVAQPSTAVDVSSQGISRPFTDRMSQLGRGFEKSFSSFDGVKGLYDAMPQYSVLASGITLADALKPEEAEIKKDKSLIRPYEFDYNATNITEEPYTGSAERTYFQPTYTALKPYAAPGPEYKSAAGGLTSLAVGGRVEEMAAQNAVGANTGYPMANLQTPLYTNPIIQNPEAANVIAPSADAGVSAYSGEARFAFGGSTTVSPQKTSPGYKYSYDPVTQQFTQLSKPVEVDIPMRGVMGGMGGMGGQYGAASSGQKGYESRPTNITSGGIAQPIMQPTNPAQPLIPNINIPAYQTPEQQMGLGGFYDMMNQQLGAYGGYQGYAAGGGVSHLGDYSDGGRLLKGPGDGVSDSIPASIGSRQPARLADGEFVVPARIVSEIGNGSTEAGARKLYAMMERVQKARGKTVGKNQVARNTKAEKLLPA